MNEDTFACDDVPEEPKVQTIAEVPQKMAQHVVGRISCMFFPILLLLVIQGLFSRDSDLTTAIQNVEIL